MDLHKEKMLKILLLFDKFCKREGLRYSLDAGTLIGAIRHGGFIPWDDDIDVIMPRPDYMRFIQLTRHKFSDGYKVMSPYHTPEYYLGFSKIIDTNTTIVEYDKRNYSVIGVFIDIFPLDSVSDDLDILSSQAQRFNKNEQYANFLMNPVIDNVKSRLLYHWLKIRNYNRGYYYLADKVASECDWGTGQRVRYFWSFTDQPLMFDASIFEKYTDVNFEGHVLPSVAEYDTYLRKLYGDYMLLPAEDQRVSTHSKLYMNLKKGISKKELIKMGVIK